MEHFSKPHLPLISQRIKFERKILPPRPTITQRLNLAQRIRRADRVRFSAAGPRSKSREPALKPPSRNPSRASTPRASTPAADEMSELSDLTEDEDEDAENGLEGSETEGMGGTAKIPKPNGAIGRKSGGWNLEESLGWEAGKYKRLISWINSKIKTRLDDEKSFKYQSTKVLNEVIREGIREFEIEDMYENNWPIREGLKMRLKTTSESAKRKGKGNTEKRLIKALEGVIEK